MSDQCRSRTPRPRHYMSCWRGEWGKGRGAGRELTTSKVREQTPNTLGKGGGTLWHTGSSLRPGEQRIQCSYGKLAPEGGPRGPVNGGVAFKGSDPQHPL